jgi:FKBP-type peptidyl-prolyl cis-trans isomerase SlyD
MTIIDESGKRTEQVEKSKPLNFLVGRGNLLESFEQRLLGLSKDDAFDFVLKSSSTYGPYKKQAVQTFNKSDIIDGVDLKEADVEVGSSLPMQTEDGIPFTGQVIEILDNKIVIDFNHPLAGKDLHFKGSIISVREATPDELSKGTQKSVKQPQENKAQDDDSPVCTWG